MPNVGIPELLIVLVIALVIFGPKKLPELGQSLGRGIREFRNSIGGDSDDDPVEITSISEPRSTAESGRRNDD